MSNIIDARDLYKKLEEMRDEKENLENTISDLEDELIDLEDRDEKDLAEIDFKKEELEEVKIELAEWIDENQEEFDELETLENEISEFMNGETLIPEDEWEEYVEEFLKDCGDLPDNIPWYIVIDWSQTAKIFAQGYSLIDYQGTTYYYRNC